MTPHEAKIICAAGTGTMGLGTAASFAVAGKTVRLLVNIGAGDTTAEIIENKKRATLDKIRKALEVCQANGLLRDDVSQIMDRISATTNIKEAATDADIVIESIYEDLGAKQRLYAELNNDLPQHAYIFTNSSGLSPTQLFSTLPLERQARCGVAHYWNPPDLIPLVEIVPGENTSQETVDFACDLMREIGKKPVPMRHEALGFIGNRLQTAILRQAYHLAASETSDRALNPEIIDAAFKNGVGRLLAANGPFEVAAFVDQDILSSMLTDITPTLSDEKAVPALLKQAKEEGRLGAKSDKGGLYQWTMESKNALIQKRATSLRASS